MRRRVFVSTLAVIGAGCLDGQEPNDGGGQTPEESEDAEETEEEETNEIELREDTEEVHDELVQRFFDGDVVADVGNGMKAAVRGTFRDVATEDTVTASIAVLEDAGEDSPALFQSVIANQGNTKVTVEPKNLPPGNGVGETEDGKRIYAFPTEGHGLTNEKSEFRRDDSGIWYVDVTPEESRPETVELDPGVGYVGEYGLVSEEANLAAGVYEFDSFEVAVWDSEYPGPEHESIFEGEDLPEIPREKERETAWYHQADESTEVYLEPSSEKVEPTQTVDFTLVNYSTELVTGNPEAWWLYKVVDGDLYHIAPEGHRLPLGRLPPGNTKVDTCSFLHGEDNGEGEGITVDRLGGGTYVYSVDMSREDEVQAAAFDFDAPSVELDAPEDADVEQDDREVVVTLSGVEDEEPGYEVAVERVDAEGERVIAEQLYRRSYEVLRYSVPFFDDETKEVVVRGTGTADPFENDESVFVYDGQSYKIRRR